MQKCKFFMEKLRVTQKALDTYSHAGSLAVDFGGKDGGIDKLYAPCDMIVKRVRLNATGELYVESLSPVLFADGSSDYLHAIFIHGDNKRIATGQIFKQGDLFYSEGGWGGGKSNAFANHVHVEAGKGKFNQLIQFKNPQGTYVIENQSPLEKLFILGNDVEIIEGGGYDWKREEKNAVSTPPISPPLSTEQYKIIDISKWNADIDFEEIKAHNCNNVIIRGASWNNATAPYIDEYFEKNYLKAKEANLKVGFYYTTYAVNALEADLEVNLVLQLLKGKQFELPVFIDVEVKQLHEHTYQTKQYNAELIDYALSKISAKGYFVGIYIGNDFINNYVDMSMLTKYDIWLAHYVDESRKNKIAHTIWQWGGEYFDKMNKNLDSNIAYKDYSFIEKQGLNGFAKVELPIEPPSDTTDLIINGLKAENKVLLDENGKLHLDIDNLSSENTVLNKSIEEKNDKISNLTLLLLKVEKSNKQLLLEVEQLKASGVELSIWQRFNNWLKNIFY